MFPDSQERNRKTLSLSSPCKCSGKITPDAAAITSPLCPWLFSGLPEQKRPISEGMSLLLSAHEAPSGRAAHGTLPAGLGWGHPGHLGVWSTQQPWDGTCHRNLRTILKACRHGGNGLPPPSVSWPGSLLRVGGEKQSEARAENVTLECQAAPESQRQSSLQAETALVPASLHSCPRGCSRGVSWLWQSLLPARPWPGTH